MLYEKDWFMRQITLLAQSIARLLLGRDFTPYAITSEHSRQQADAIFRELVRLVRRGEIRQAEGLLMLTLNESDLRYLEIGLDFYLRVNALSDEALEKAGFPREEIESGLKALAARYGLEGAAEFL